MMMTIRRMTLMGAATALLTMAACSRPISGDVLREIPATSAERPLSESAARPTATPIVVDDLSPMLSDAGAQLPPEPFISPEQMTFEGKLDIGGRALHLASFGMGEPVVVFDMGFGAAGAGALAYARELAQTTRVCYYDRPNTGDGYSDSVGQSRTCQNIVVDLAALVRKAGLVSPYILVGAGFGGLNTTLYASERQNEVVGLVLLDPLPPGVVRAWKTILEAATAPGTLSAGVFPLADIAHGFVENVDMPACARQLRAAPRLLSVEVAMLTSESPTDGWTAIADQDLKAKLEAAWILNRSFYNRIAPALEVIETGDNHLLTLPASRARVSWVIVEVVEAFRQ